VVGEIHHHRYQPESGFPTCVVGHVLPNDLGLGDLHWDHWFVSGFALLVPSIPSHDPHIRSTDASTETGGENGRVEIGRREKV
jgi:hypothetical protein